MYIFEFNDSLRYRSRQALADELREIADRIESGCNSFPSITSNVPAGWLQRDLYDSNDSDYDEEYDYDEEELDE